LSYKAKILIDSCLRFYFAVYSNLFSNYNKAISKRNRKRNANLQLFVVSSNKIEENRKRILRFSLLKFLGFVIASF